MPLAASTTGVKLARGGAQELRRHDKDDGVGAFDGLGQIGAGLNAVR
jgi:hypothetical protein